MCLTIYFDCARICSTVVTVGTREIVLAIGGNLELLATNPQLVTGSKAHATNPPLGTEPAALATKF